MKLSEIEAKYEDVDYGQPLYDEHQMQEYAKECVREALNILDNTILPIFEDDERVVMKKIFEEDTKND